MAAADKAHDRWRNAKRRVMRRLADRRTRRHVLLILVTLLAIGSLAAVKGLIGYYVFSSGATRFEVALIVAAAIAAVFALGERKVANALEARFNRNTRKHREALVALCDELADIPARTTLEQRLVARFDELFATRGTVLYIDDGAAYAVAASSSANAAPIAYDDPLVTALRERHAPVMPADTGSSLAAPLVWPLRSRGHLIGMLAAGEHDYLESFDASEIETVEAVADAAAANLALLDSSLAAHLVRTPNNLPPALATFIGRETELTECRALLAQTRLLTLTGFGGAGKTCLARRLAEEALASHRGGVWWVELAGVADDAHVASAVAAAIGVEQTQHVTANDLVRRLGNEGVLVVFDTCEHARAACAALATQLLRDCRRLSMLATSQSPLGVPGERDYALPPLDVPEGDDDVDKLARCDAVRLFVERAQAAAPGFAPDAAQMRDIVAIVRQLDGIPLAIELAAARLRLLSLSTIRGHLDDSLRLLGGGDHAEMRHGTMRASLAWSYDPLAEAQQRLLRRLSVFVHGFTLEAAARVAANADDALDVLDPIGALVEASLVMVSRHGAGEPRYHLPETLRQFAHERLVLDADATQVLERHARYYVDLAAREASALRHRDVANALDRLDRESANLAAAHAWYMQSPQQGETVLSLAHSLAPYFRARGLIARGIGHLRDAVSQPGIAVDSRMRAWVLFDLAQLEQAAGDHTSAQMHLTQARNAATPDLACRILGREAISLQATNEATAARRSIGDAVAAARALDDVETLHAALGDAVRVAMAQRDVVRARAWLCEAIDLALDSDAVLDGNDDLALCAALARQENDWSRAARFAGALEAAGARSSPAQDDARAALGAVAYAVAFESGHRQKLADALRDARARLTK